MLRDFFVCFMLSRWETAKEDEQRFNFTFPWTICWYTSINSYNCVAVRKNCSIKFERKIRKSRIVEFYSFNFRCEVTQSCLSHRLESRTKSTRLTVRNVTDRHWRSFHGSVTNWQMLTYPLWYSIPYIDRLEINNLFYDFLRW